MIFKNPFCLDRKETISMIFSAFKTISKKFQKNHIEKYLLDYFFWMSFNKHVGNFYEKDVFEGFHVVE